VENLPRSAPENLLVEMEMEKEKGGLPFSHHCLSTLHITYIHNPHCVSRNVRLFGRMCVCIYINVQDIEGEGMHRQAGFHLVGRKK
jgi:hypothetical protein